MGDVVAAALEAKVRLYPIAYGDDLDMPPLIEAAEETGELAGVGQGSMLFLVECRDLAVFLGREPYPINRRQSLDWVSQAAITVGAVSVWKCLAKIL